MPNPWAIYYEAISEPVLPEALQPEVVELDKWWARDVRPAQLVVFFDRGYLDALVQFDALFPADTFMGLSACPRASLGVKGIIRLECSWPSLLCSGKRGTI